MRRVLVCMFVSLDGKIAGPRGDLEWMPGNGKPDGEVDRAVDALLDDVDTILLGRVTYELFLDFWPGASSADDLVADKLNACSKVVFSRTLATVHWGRWNNARVAGRPLAEEIAHLKRQRGKDMVAFGGARLARALLSEHLVDELLLFVAPILLGGGTPLFEDGATTQELDLQELTAFASGTVLLRYRPERPAG